MSIKDICTENVKYVDPDTSLTEVARLMAELDCGSILVAENDRLTGVITDRDIVLRCVAKSENPDSMTADQCKTPSVLYCYENDEVEDILKNMADNKIRRLPVLNNDEDKKLVGIVSFGDLSAACERKEVSGEAMEKIRRAA